MHPPVLDATRREFLAGGAALAALLAAGCGSAGTPTGAASGRQVQGVLGETYTLDGPPARLYASGGADLNNALVLGVVPAVVELGESAEFTPEQVAAGVGTAEVIRWAEGPNFEAIAAAGPDLNLIQWGDETYQRRFAAIAPSVNVDSSKPWRDHLRDVAHVLFRDAEAELAIGELELRFEEFRERFADRAGQVPSLLYVAVDGSLTLMTRESGIAALLAELGFGELALSGDPYGEAVSAETVGGLATGDFLLVAVDSWKVEDPDEPLPAVVADFLDSPVGRAIPAAAGGVHLLPRDGNLYFYYLDALSIPSFVDDLAELLG